MCQVWSAFELGLVHGLPHQRPVVTFNALPHMSEPLHPSTVRGYPMGYPPCIMHGSLQGDVGGVTCGSLMPTTCSGLIWWLGVPPQRHATPVVAVNTPVQSTHKCRHPNAVPGPNSGLETAKPAAQLVLSLCSSLPWELARAESDLGFLNHSPPRPPRRWPTVSIPPRCPEPPPDQNRSQGSHK